MFLEETPVWIVLLPFVIMSGLAYFTAYIYRDTNDFRKSAKLYFPLAVVVAAGFAFLGLPIILGGFMIFACFVMLMFISNRFFYS